MRTWLSYKGLHPQQKALDSYIFTFKLCVCVIMNPLNDIYSRLNPRQTKITILELQVLVRLHTK